MGKAIIKIIVGLVIGVGLYVGTMALDFPPVFRWLFFGYAVLGTVVFLILDAPTMKVMSGGKALVSLLVFYAILCTVFISGAALWPQYDPEDEKGKIVKILKGKPNILDPWKADEVIARTKELDLKAKELTERIKALGTVQGVAGQDAGAAAAPVAAGASGGDVLKIGEEQWQLQECYNCHKLNGEGGKKRGPELDNIGTLLSQEEIAKKILDPKSYKAEGFDAEYDKGKMPDKYKDLMDLKDVQALAAWLATFKNTSVNTPKPIKMK